MYFEEAQNQKKYVPWPQNEQQSCLLPGHLLSLLHAWAFFSCRSFWLFSSRHCSPPLDGAGLEHIRLRNMLPLPSQGASQSVQLVQSFHWPWTTVKTCKHLPFKVNIYTLTKAFPGQDDTKNSKKSYRHRLNHCWFPIEQAYILYKKKICPL